MAKIYPEIEPFVSGTLNVGNGNTIYWEIIGSPTGIPAVFVHGGPGSGSSTKARQYFDPKKYRAVLFDQRGCGRSHPLISEPGSDLSTNTIEQLIADIERLREHLSIENWLVVGISWGVTLGVIYAQRFPKRVSAMVLAAITMGTRREITWITKDMGRIFPREWERFIALIPENERSGDIATAYAQLLASPDEEIRVRAALEWCQWEDTHVSLMPGWKPDKRYQDPTFRLTFSRLVTHYWSNSCFLKEDEVMAGMHRLTNIPATLVHGRWDISSPLDTAWKLHGLWPKSTLHILGEAGHGGTGFAEAIKNALDEFCKMEIDSELRS
jgi:proline iminopeptidase